MRRLGLECIRRSYDLLICPDWKFEKQTNRGDKIYSSQREGLGKVYRLTATVNYSASALIYEMFTKVEDVPKWNPSLLESKVVHKIDYFTDISYQASAGAGGGLVKSRDFVNLRCYRVVENGQILSEQDMRNKSKAEGIVRPERRSSLSTVHEQSEGEGSSVRSEANSSVLNESYQTHSAAGSVGNSISGSNFAGVPEQSKRGQAVDGDEEREEFSECDKEAVDRYYISSARSIAYPGYEAGTKYLRGENIISCWATRDVAGHPNECVFEWILCLDLKGYIMVSVLDTVSVTSMELRLILTAIFPLLLLVLAGLQTVDAGLHGVPAQTL